MKEIRLGTIGSGRIVHEMLDNVKITEGIRLAAVYARREEKGQLLAGKYGVNRVYTDMDKFLCDEDVNTVYIATPNLLHYEQAKKALLAGKNVICEKPFCTKAEQARELMALARERQLYLVDAVPTAFLPNLDILKRELAKVGRVKLVQANYSQYSSRYDQLLKGEVTNIFDPAYGGGCLMDINFYNVYLNIALFGKPQKAVYYPNRYGDLADTSGIMVMQYDGFVSESAGAKDTWGVNFFQIEGEQGYIYVRDGSNGIAEVRVVTKTSEETFNMQDNPNRWFYEVQKLTELLLKDDQDAIDQRLAVMLDVVGVLEEARKKAGILFPGDSVREMERGGGSGKDTGIRPAVIQEIIQLAEKYGIDKVILFGSRARGDYKKTSDIDLAVSGKDVVRFALDVDEKTSTLLKYDIVDMGGSMQDALRESIAQEGRILYEKI